MKYAEVYKNTLLNDVLLFWEKHSLDTVHGGYFTCLDQTGKVYNTDKFVWFARPESLDVLHALQSCGKAGFLDANRKSGVMFLKNHGRDSKGDFYFTLTQEGKPLVQSYNIFSDCFVAMAFGQYAKASGGEEYKVLAKRTYLNILNKKDDDRTNSDIVWTWYQKVHDYSWTHFPDPENGMGISTVWENHC